MVNSIEQPRKVLIVGNKLLGDAIDSLNSVLFLAEKGCWSKDSCDYYFIGYRYSGFVYQKNNFLDCQYVEDFKKIFFFNGVKYFFKYFRKFDLIYILPGGFGWGLLAFLLAGKKRVGHHTDGRSFLLTHSVELNRNQPNHLNFNELYYSTIKNKDKKEDEKSSPLISPITYDDDLLPIDYFDADKYGLTKPWVVMAIMASEAHKVWPHEYFVSLAGKVKSKYGCKIVLVGAPQECDVIQEVARQMQIDEEIEGVNLAGKLSITQVFSLIKDSLFFVGNDSGLTHAAAMLGTPNFTIVGPTNPTLSFPYSLHKNTYFIYHEVGLPHARRRDKDLTPELKEKLSMKSVRVEYVWEKINTEMQKNNMKI